MAKKLGRWLALDILKACGVFFMIVLHTVVWWYIPLDYGSENVSDIFFVFLPILKLIGIFVITLPITAGASLRFYLKKSPSSKSIKSIFTKSILLIAAGYLLNFLAWGKEEFLNWDVLQFIGTGFILLVFLAKFLPLNFLWVIGSFVLFSAPFLRALLDRWKFNYIAAVLISNEEGNFFWPFFPWFSFLIFGFLIADNYINYKNRKRFYLAIVAAGILVVSITLYKDQLFFMPDVRNFWGPEIFQAPALTLLGGLSTFGISLAIAGIFFEKKIRILKFGFINTFSKGIFWIYVLHIIIGYNFVNFVQKHMSNGIFVMFITMIFLIFISYLIGFIVVWQKDKNKRLAHQ